MADDSDLNIEGPVEHREKKDKQIGFKTCLSNERYLNAMAELEGMTLSSFIDKIITEHRKNTEVRARLINEALGINVN